MYFARDMLRGQQEFRFNLAPTPPLETQSVTTTSDEAENAIVQLVQSSAPPPSNNMVPQLLEEQLQNQQQLLQQLLQDQESRFKELLQQQENRLKIAFLTQIASLTAAMNTAMQRAAAGADLGIHCSVQEDTRDGGLANSSLYAHDHASNEVHFISGTPTFNNTDVAQADVNHGVAEIGAEGMSVVHAAPAEAVQPAQVHIAEAGAHDLVADADFSEADTVQPAQAPAAEAVNDDAAADGDAAESSVAEADAAQPAQPATINTLMQKAATRVDIGIQCSELEETTAGGPADSCLHAPDHVSNEVHSISGDDASEAAPALLSAPAPQRITSAEEGFASPVQLLTRHVTPPIPIPTRSGAHAYKSSKSGWPQSSLSLEGSSPRISAFQLGLSGNDFMSSSDWGMESEDEEGGLPISSRQLDSSPEKSDSEGSGTAWVSSLGRHSRRKELSDLPHRAWPATAPRPRARAIGGQLAAARARTSAAALTAVATAAALSALRPASTATAAPTAVAPSDFHIAAAPAASADALAEALAAALCALAPADALSAGRPTATAALSPAQPESAQALQADDGQLADAGEEAMAEVGSEQTMPVQASEADAARLRVVAPSDALSGLSLSSASPMTLGGDSTDPTAAAHQLADAQSAAQEEAVHSEGPLALDQESVQPTAAAAEQLADVQTAMLQSRRWAEDSCEEDWCVAEDYFSTPLPWKQPQQAKYSVESAVAASVEAAALVTQEETVGSDPGAELVNATMEGASQLGGMMFGTMTAADLLGVEGRQHMGSLGAASPTAPAIASASKAGVVAVHTAVASMGTNEDRLGAMAASAAEEGVSVSQFGGMMFGTITAADLLAASTHRADARLGASEDTLCTAAAGAAEGNASVSQLGGIRFGTITAADLLTASTYRADARLGASEDRLCTAAAGAAEHTDSRSQLSSSNHDSFRLTDTQTAVSHDGKEDCKEDEEEEAQVNTSLGYTAFVTDSLLNRMEQQAGNDGGHINVLDVRDNMDLVDMGGSDNQVYYNLALLEGINEQLAAASRKMQPPAPAMQQLTPLRRPPSTPRAIACAVHDDIMRSVHLAEASMPDGFKHSRLLAHDAKDHLKSVDEGTAGAEASIKIAIADSIFEDLIEDTALAFLDAHGLQEPPEPAVILET